ncbi:hypothetical protein CC80DRAFT_116880 [Byssothecium circinans]|uniref:Uncharacterized protein n=1 Tax=Byssothecium circinans TaxID=147558 RepID=A0A6A5TT43_9PLEO|nr:hypothetical protein CC80DRAFT_116880 [Byssothecium circinans]
MFLPTPLPANSLHLGQLVTSPLDPSRNSTSSTPTSPKANKPVVHRAYEDYIIHDVHGQLIRSRNDQTYRHGAGTVSLKAEEMTYTSLKNPSASFDELHEDEVVRSFLHSSAMREQPVYFVTAIQTLKNPVFTPLNGLESVPKLPKHVRRDSALALDTTENNIILSVELRKVRCMISPRAVPHSINDIGYSWSHYDVDGQHDPQLSIGLALRELTDTELDEEGLGGFGLDDGGIEFK